MTLETRINTFVKLGDYLKNDFFLEHSDVMDGITFKNPWFIKSSIKSSLNYWGTNLDLEVLKAWLNPYYISNKTIPKRVLIIMAGNIPLVGFHDFLSVIISGNKAVIKLSSDDNILMPLIIEKLIDINPDIEKYIELNNEIKEKVFDAVIATGSDNSSNYFEYYFKDIPKIIRKNRTSIAVLDGDEEEIDLKGLAHDVFSFFGLGCRNVSKIFLPEGYDLNKLFQVFYSYKSVLEHRKYVNNYSYNKTIFLMGGHKLIDNGFLLLKEDKSLLAPIAMLYYEFYSDIKQIEGFILSNKDKLQCVISKSETPFGYSQKPNLWDYADGIDSINFLKNI